MRHPTATSLRLRATLTGAAIVLALLAAGCADGDGEGGTDVRAAEEIFEADPVVETDPSGTAAVLRVETRLDMACAVVWGTTESLGDGIATDTDMGGGAHRQHAAVMSGLEPDTTYYYRVQGSGADGALYRSELRTFTTPPAAEDAAERVDATVADVSSEFSDAFAAANAVDGDLATEWSSDGDGDDTWIELDLGGPTEVGSVAVRTREMSDGTAIIETFAVVPDGGEPLGPFTADGTPAAVDVTAERLRIEAVETTGGNTGAVEIELFAGR